MGINVKLYDLLQQETANQFHWFCSCCNNKIVELCNLTVRCDRMENQIKEIQEDLKNKADVNFVKNQFQEIEHKLVKQLQSKFSNEDADAALIKIDSSLTTKLTQVQMEIGR